MSLERLLRMLRVHEVQKTVAEALHDFGALPAPLSLALRVPAVVLAPAPFGPLAFGPFFLIFFVVVKLGLFFTILDVFRFSSQNKFESKASESCPA